MLYGIYGLGYRGGVPAPGPRRGGTLRGPSRGPRCCGASRPGGSACRSCWWPTATWASGRRRPGRCGRRPGSSGAGTTRWPTCSLVWPKREQTEAKELLREVVYAPSRAGADKARDAFADQRRHVSQGGRDPGRRLGRMTAFFDFPARHWRHLRTTNVVESPFAAVRLRTSVAARGARGQAVRRRQARSRGGTARG